MKKLFLTAALIAGLFYAQAQTKQKVKPVIKTGTGLTINIDTVYTLNPADVAARLVNVKNLITIILQPGDVTPNQRAQAMHTADSLFKADVTWYNKVKAPKPAPATVPAKQ